MKDQNYYLALQLLREQLLQDKDVKVKDGVITEVVLGKEEK